MGYGHQDKGVPRLAATAAPGFDAPVLAGNRNPPKPLYPLNLLNQFKLLNVYSVRAIHRHDPDPTGGH